MTCYWARNPFLNLWLEGISGQVYYILLNTFQGRYSVILAILFLRSWIVIHNMCIILKALGMYFKPMKTLRTKWTSRWSFLSEVPPRHQKRPSSCWFRSDRYLPQAACLFVPLSALGWATVHCWRPRIASSSGSCAPRQCLPRLKFISPSNRHIACRWVLKWVSNGYSGPLLYRHLPADLSLCSKNMKV